MNYKRITVETLSKIVIGLCVIIAIAVFAGTFQTETFETVSRLNESISEMRSQVDENEETISQSEVQIAEAQEKLPALKKAKTTAEKKRDKENEALDAVCDRNYFSSFYCDDPSACETLHDAVSDASNKYYSAKEELDECEGSISDARYAISEANKRIEELNKEIKAYSELKSSAAWSVFFFVVAMLLTIAALVFISMFLLNRDDRIKGLIACGMLAGASFIYMLLPTSTTFLTYLLGAGISAIIAGLISGNIQKPIVGRVVVIVLSVIIFFATLFTAPFTALCSAIAFILISLILVPCVFTEYLDIAKHIFFTIITLGIWNLIWVYNFTENLNKVKQAEKRAPIRELLLCVFLPLYHIFWTYKTAENTELYGVEKGKSFKIDILCFVLSLVCPFLASVIIQDKTNLIVGKPVANEVIDEVPVEEAAAQE